MSTDFDEQPQRPGIIRITLKKPMGIVFEPIVDNAQNNKRRSEDNLDVGAKIKDLPKHGDAAKTGQLGLGDELLSIDDEFTTDLAFDEIMNIIVREKKSLSLLFRKAPAKPKPVIDTKFSDIKSVTSKDEVDTTKKREKDYDEKAAQLIKRAVNKKKERREKDREYEEWENEGREREEWENERRGRGRRAREDKVRDLQEAQANEVVDGTFVDMLIDTLCSPCGEDDTNGNLDVNKEDGFIYLTDRTGVVQ